MLQPSCWLPSEVASQLNSNSHFLPAQLANNLWKSKYIYHTDFLCPFLKKEGLKCFAKSDLYRTEAMMINTYSHAHSSDDRHRQHRVAWFQDKMQKKEPLCEGPFPPRSKY